MKASLGQGHETYILSRPEIGVDIEKEAGMLISFKMLGAHLVPGSFSDYIQEPCRGCQARRRRRLICAISGVHIRSDHNILLQLISLAQAIKEAQNVKVYKNMHACC